MHGFTLLSYLRSVIAGRATPQIPVQESVGAKLQSRVYAPGCHNPVTLKESTLNLEEYKTAVDEADGEADQVLIKKQSLSSANLQVGGMSYQSKYKV